MKKAALFATFVLFLCSIVSTSFAVEITLFEGQYTRTKGKPNQYTAKFPGIPREAKLIVTNGYENGEHRISSAVIIINGKEVLGSNNFNQNVYEIEIPVDLVEDNTISVELKSKPESFINIQVVQELDASTGFVESTIASPDELFVNEPTDILVTALVNQNPNSSSSYVNLTETDEDGNYLGNWGQLYDDGTHGDTIPGDNIFTTTLNINEPVKKIIYFKVFVDWQYYSDVFTIDIMEHISDEDYHTAIEMPDIVKEKFESFKVMYGEDEARNRTVEWLLEQPEIFTAGISEEGKGIWFAYNSGLLGGILLSPEGTRGNIIGSTKAKGLSPYYFEFVPHDDMDGAYSVVQDSQCPSFDADTPLKHNSANVEAFKNLSDYGIVAIISHGDNWYNGLWSLWKDQFADKDEIGWGDSSSQVVVYTDTKATDANKTMYEKDLKRHRLVIGERNSLVITPRFVSKYNGEFPNSVILMGSCRSLYNDTMADAFLSKGAGVYFGYTGYVDNEYAFGCGKSIFEYMIDSKQTAGEAFSNTIDDNGEDDGDGARFEMVGNSDLSFETSSCNDDKIYNPANGHYYQRFDILVTWQEAKAHCEDLEGYLATITSQEENDFIYDNLLNVESALSTNSWLGGTDEIQEGKWEWITGEPWIYSNWAPNEPNNSRNEDYVHFYSVYTPAKWNDISNLSTFPFTCEWGDVD